MQPITFVVPVAADTSLVKVAIVHTCPASCSLSNPKFNQRCSIFSLQRPLLGTSFIGSRKRVQFFGQKLNRKEWITKALLSATIANDSDTQLREDDMLIYSGDEDVLQPGNSMLGQTMDTEPALPPGFERYSSPQRSSTKPLLIALPGLDGGACLQVQLPLLAAEFEIITYLYDASDTADWDTLAARVIAVARNERHLVYDDDRSVWLLGESFGGCVAAIAAAREPALFSRMVLVNPATSFTQNRLLPIGAPLLQLFPDALFDLARVVLVPFMAEWDRVPPEYRNIETAIRAIPQESIVRRLDMLRTFADSHGRCLEHITQPTLIIASGKDRLLPSVPEAKRLSALLPNATQCVLAASGHACLLERGVDVMELLRVHNLAPGPYRTDDATNPSASPSPSPTDDGALLPLDGRVEASTSASPPPSPTPSDRSGWTAPSADDMRELAQRYAPWTALTSPVFYNLANVPSAADLRGRPILFVGNHTTYGLLDVPLMFLTLYEEKGLLLRSLAHESHWSAFSGEILQKFGAVRATPRNFYSLMKDGEPVLLFPGGAREVCKRRGEKYQLFWKEEVDFVRVAMKMGATIVPFSAIGAEDVYDILADANDMRQAISGTPLLAELDSRLGAMGVPEGYWMPLPANVLPRVGRFYFSFGTPLDLDGYQHRVRDLALCSSLYAQIRQEVEEGIEKLKARRDQDPSADLPARLFRQSVDSVIRSALSVWDSLQPPPPPSTSS